MLPETRFLCSHGMTSIDWGIRRGYQRFEQTMLRVQQSIRGIWCVYTRGLYSVWIVKNRSQRDSRSLEQQDAYRAGRCCVSSSLSICSLAPVADAESHQKAHKAMALLDRDQLFRRLRGKQDNKVKATCWSYGGGRSSFQPRRKRERGRGGQDRAWSRQVAPTCLGWHAENAAARQLAWERRRQRAMGCRTAPTRPQSTAPPPMEAPPLLNPRRMFICCRSALTVPPRTPPGPLFPMASSSASPARASTAAWACTSAS